MKLFLLFKENMSWSLNLLYLSALDSSCTDQIINSMILVFSSAKAANGAISDRDNGHQCDSHLGLREC